MIINITCPNCNFSKQIPSENIPAGIKHAKCPRCSKTFEIPVIPEEEPVSMEKLPEAPVQQETPPPLPDVDKVTDVTAEPVDEHASPIGEERGYFGDLLRVFSGVLLSPTEFFRGVKETSLKEALIFGILTGSIGLMFQVFWIFFFLSNGDSNIINLFPDLTAINDTFLRLIIWSPFFVFIQALFVSAVVHVILFMIGGVSRGFEGTLKVILYSKAVSILCVLPYIGDIIAFVWSLTIIVTGIREVHETSNGKAVFSLLLPVFLIMIAIYTILYLASKMI
ncbi:MAG: hypothetical protein GX654_06440 [Desulfatiglans sp.]|nr:hypothetical protein [Desulfatiglans sp.]